MPTSGTTRRWRLTLPPGRLESLAWASPYVIFLLLPVIGAVQLGVATPQGAAVLAATLIFGAVYLLSWLFNESAPPDSHSSRIFVAWFMALCATYGLLHLSLEWSGLGSGTYYLTFCAAAFVFQAPKKWLMPGVTVLLFLVGLLANVITNDGLIPFVVATITTIAALKVRNEVEREQYRSLQLEHDLELSRERERVRLSADLHDILGHTLTGITVTADLAGRLLDAGKIDQARAQLDELTEMSRQALADVRQVVAGNRSLEPAAEIDSVRRLLASAHVECVVINDGEPSFAPMRTLVAHAIREGCTNALRHANANTVTIHMRTDGVTITNDMARRGRRNVPRAEGSSGTGLEALRERGLNIATVTWGLRDAQWVLDVKEDRG